MVCRGGRRAARSVGLGALVLLGCEPNVEVAEPTDTRDFGISASLAWSWVSPNVGSFAGLSMGWAGDVNGDGYDDILVGAPYWSDGQTEEGAALLFLGPPTPGSSPDWVFTSDEANARAATSVAGAGDINGDGYTDILVGTSGFDGGGANAGAAWMFLGGPTGPSTTPDWVTFGVHPGAGHGVRIAGPGDVNGDGFADVLVSAFQEESTLVAEGAVHLYLGSASGLPTTPDWSAWGGQANAKLGAGLGWAGDIDGDGYSDVLAGAYLYDAGETNEGAAFFWFGGPSGPGSAVDWSVADAGAGDSFGYTLSGVGDTDGDGYGEIIIGAYLYEPGGGAWLYPGSAAGPLPAPNGPRTLQSGGLLGICVLPAGDLDGDGFADAAVGGPGYSNGNGILVTYLGDAGGLDFANGTQDLSWTSSSGVRLGRDAAAVGDSDGDGRAELSIGLPYWDSGGNNAGGVFLRESDLAPPSATPTLSLAGDQTGAGLADSDAAIDSGDLNGDGYDELVVGRPSWDDTLTDQGSVAVHEGGQAGLVTPEDQLLLGTSAGERFGAAVRLGDIDGDGELDLAVGSPEWNGGSGAEGRVRVFLGTATGLETTASWEATSGQAGAEFGATLAMADFDGDGHADLVVGAPVWDDAFSDGGAVFGFAGGPTGLESAASWSWFGASTDARFGQALAVVGDTDGDGLEDLAVGEPFFDGAASEAGRAYLFPGSASGLATAPTLTLQGTLEGQELGTCLAGADLDGDGYSDLTVGEPGLRTIKLYWGGASGPTALNLSPLVANSGRPRYGAACSTGDHNRDGIADLLAAAPVGNGKAWGHPGPVVAATAFDFEYEPGGGGQTGWALHQRGDFDGDGAADLVIGALAAGDGLIDVFTGLEGSVGGERAPMRLRIVHAGSSQRIPRGGRSDSAGFDVVGFVRSPYTRARARLQVEAKPTGVPFDGLGLIDSGAWTDLGMAGMDLTVPLTALPLDTAYQVRARVVWDPSQALPASRGPWIGAFPGTPTGVHVRTTNDQDGDGFVGADDCDDNDASIYVGATEACDAIDSDCDGSLADEFPDLDGDGEPDCIDDDVDGDGQSPVADGGTDCDDNDASIYDGAPEFCDTVDADCDGSIADEFADLDGDGEPDCLDEDVDGDGQPPPSAGGTDCDDFDATVYDGAQDFCDAVDQDCDGDLVETFDDTDGDLMPDCADLDDDGDGWDDDADCEPLRADAHPDAEEACDGIDTDCDGSLRFDEVDEDGDGVLLCQEILGDCGGDNDPAVFPGAPEVCDALDNDCNGETDEGLTFEDWYRDNDLDGFAGNVPYPSNPLCADPGAGWEREPDTDCDDENPGINPDATEVEGNNVDEDCDGTAQGAPVGDDDDSSPAPPPDAPGCACSTNAKSTPSALGGLLALPLLLRRRRRVCPGRPSTR